jgi:serine/threonine protein phosphatase 1
MGRILVISDIHGMHEEFDKLINGINYDPDNDQLILLGDYIDRGPEPTKCLERVIQLTQVGAIALLGNHESMCLEVVKEIERGDLKYEDLKNEDRNGTYESL